MNRQSTRKGAVRVRAKTTKLVILVLFFWAFTTSAHASDAYDFLQKGISARPAAMGNAFVAVSDHADSVYWNPASLALMSMMKAGSVHSSLDDFDMNTDAISFAGPIDIGDSGFGLSFFRSSIGNIESVIPTGCTSSDDPACRPNPQGFFDEHETGFMGGYGFRVRDDLLAGATLKYLSMKFLGYSASGVGLDLGFLYSVAENVKLGGNLQNVVPVKLGSDRVPFNAKLGVLYTSKDKKLNLASDLDTNIADDMVFHIGAEYWLVPQLALRVGANDGDLTAGVGLSGLAGGWQFDYAFNDGDVGDTHKISVAFNFEQKPRVKKQKTAAVSSSSGVEFVQPAAAPAPEPEKKAEPAPAPAPEKVAAPAPAPVVEKKAEPAPAPAKEKPALTNVYSFFEGDDIVTLNYTELKAGQHIIIYRKGSKVADASITDVGMLSATGKINKLFVDKLTDYMIGDQINIQQ